VPFAECRGAVSVLPQNFGNRCNISRPHAVLPVKAVAISVIAPMLFM
jgi:hypothetical protein